MQPAVRPIIILFFALCCVAQTDWIGLCAVNAMQDWNAWAANNTTVKPVLVGEDGRPNNTLDLTTAWGVSLIQPLQFPKIIRYDAQGVQM